MNWTRKLKFIGNLRLIKSIFAYFRQFWFRMKLYFIDRAIGKWGSPNCCNFFRECRCSDKAFAKKIFWDLCNLNLCLWISFKSYIKKLWILQKWFLLIMVGVNWSLSFDNDLIESSKLHSLKYDSPKILFIKIKI